MTATTRGKCPTESSMGPIFLFGLARSGTTWVAKILDSSPEVLYVHEADFSSRFSVPPLLLAGESEKYSREIREYIARLASVCSTHTSTVLPVFRKDYLSALGYQRWRATVLGLKVLAKLVGDFSVPRALRPPIRTPNPRVLFKSVGCVGRVRAIADGAPGSKTIVLLRNPCGMMASRLQAESEGHFTYGTPASDKYPQFRQLLESSERLPHWPTYSELAALDPLERLAWRWCIFYEKAMLEAEGRDDFDVVRYEDVCRAPLEFARDAFEFCGLKWSRQTEQFIHASTTTVKAGYFSLYRNPAESAGKWRRRFSADEMSRIRQVVSQCRPGQLYLDDLTEAISEARSKEVEVGAGT